MSDDYDMDLDHPLGLVCRIYGVYYWRHEVGLRGFALTEHGALKALRSIENSSKSAYRTKGSVKLVIE